MMVGTLIINGLVYTYNVGLPVTAYVGFKTNICDLPNNISDGLEVDYVWVYTPNGSPKNIKYMVYTEMGGSTTINVMVYTLFGGSPKLKVWTFTLFFIGTSNA